MKCGKSEISSPKFSLVWMILSKRFNLSNFPVVGCSIMSDVGDSQYQFSVLDHKCKIDQVVHN